MAENSNIGWTDHTFNPWIGCTKVSPGCANCYADQQDKLRKWTPEGWGKGKPRKRTSTANWKLPLKWNRQTFKCKAGCEGWWATNACGECGEWCETKRPRVFCASMSDWLDDEVPIEWLSDLLKLIHDTPNLDWLLLTKRPENWWGRVDGLDGAFKWWADNRIRQAPQFMNWLAAWIDGEPPNNVWLGTSVENQEWADKRIPELLRIPARVRFLSCEPLLGAVDLRRYFAHSIRCEKLPGPGMNGGEPCSCPGIHWVIAGGESGPKRREMNLDWLRSLHNQCRNAGVAWFCKQDSALKPGQRGRIPDELWKQEFPRGAVLLGKGAE